MHLSFFQMKLAYFYSETILSFLFSIIRTDLSFFQMRLAFFYPETILSFVFRFITADLSFLQMKISSLNYKIFLSALFRFITMDLSFPICFRCAHCRMASCFFTIYYLFVPSFLVQRFWVIFIVFLEENFDIKN